MSAFFEEYLKKKNTQKRIDKLAKKYAGKKVILYGAGIFAEKIAENYDLSKLNIIAVADGKFSSKKEFYGYKLIDPYSLQDKDFDVLIITTYKDFEILDFFEDTLFCYSIPKFKIETMVKMSFWEHLKIA